MKILRYRIRVIMLLLFIAIFSVLFLNIRSGWFSSVSDVTDSDSIQSDSFSPIVSNMDAVSTELSVTDDSGSESLWPPEQSPAGSGPGIDTSPAPVTPTTVPLYDTYGL